MVRQILDTLDVYLIGRKVGRIEYASHHNEMRFSYTDDYLSASDAVALSYALPLQRDAFDSARTTVFFENLLPPDQVRKKIGSILHISHHNIFGFLKALGGDCAGAISLWPQGMVPKSGEERLWRLNDDEAHEVLSSLRKRPLYVNGIDGYRISGAGAQNKLIARLVDGHVILPLFGAPSTHIIKPSVQDYEDSTYNECFSMRLAGHLGLKVAKSGLMRLKEDVYYWTERFDRETVDGKICRLHQEDFCQICGVSGKLKYEDEGGPSFADCMAAMGKMKIALSDRIRFIDRMIFNYLIGNADAHGKNSSILYRGRTGKSLAPIYDVMSTAVYDQLSKTNAMTIGGAKSFVDVRRANFGQMAKEVGMRPELVLDRLDRIAKAIVPVADALSKELSAEWPSEVYGKIGEVIKRHVSAVLPDV